MVVRIILALLAIICVAGSAHAQDDRSAAIADSTARLIELRQTLDHASAEDSDALDETLRALRDQSRARLAAAERELESVRRNLADLGPPPAEGAPPEEEPVASRRAALTAEQKRLEAQKIQITANVNTAGDLLAKASAARIRSLYRTVLERGPTPLSPVLWNEASTATAQTATKIGVYFENWSSAKRKSGGLALPLGLIGGALVFSLFLFGPVNRWINEGFANRIQKMEPTQGRRVVVAGLKMVARAAPGLAGGAIILAALRAQGVIGAAGVNAAQALWFGLVALLLVEGFTSGLFAPANPQWRIAPVAASKGRRASAYLLSIVAIFGLKTLLNAIGAATGAGEASRHLLDAMSATAIGVLLFMLCRRGLWVESVSAETPPAGDAEGEFKAGGDLWRFVRRFGRLVAVVIVVAALAGYVKLADFVSSRFYFFALFLAVAWFLRALLREGAAYAEKHLQTDGRGAGDERDDKKIFQFWLGVAVDAALLIAFAPAVMLLLGLPATNVRDFVVEAFFGFSVGSVRVSIAGILGASLVFIAILAATRLIQRGLRQGVFAHSRLDIGVENSLNTLIGYAGLLIAAVFAVTTLGFNLSNLAIIAGALSVGIGFGLQGVVNNFVSGLILLFERPIKVGDWIVVPSGEGTVKKISVRSTEIETFDRSSIIVPNSELVTSTVMNWTHKDRIGRITVAVGVSYGSDPELVRDILLKCADDHPAVVRYPESFVVWKDFGESSLDFEIRAYLRDISQGLRVRTELRFAIFKAFKEAGIEIPFPQRDLHIRSAPDGKLPAHSEPLKEEPVPPPPEPEIAEDD